MSALLYLRAKRASNLQKASFFQGLIKGMFPLGIQVRAKLIEGDLVGQWEKCVMFPFGSQL